MSVSPRRTRVLSAVLLAALALGARMGEARQCTHGSNLVPNCDFATDLTEWIFTGDSAVHVPGDGDFAPGCAAIDRHDGVGATEAFTDCLDVEPSRDYTVGGSARISSGAMPTACQLSVVHYSDANCADYVAEPSNDIPLTTAWSEFWRIHGMGPTTQSAKVRFACFHSGADFVVRIDDFWFAEVIFEDGFEGGDTDAWSIAVP